MTDPRNEQAVWQYLRADGWHNCPNEAAARKLERGGYEVRARPRSDDQAVWQVMIDDDVWADVGEDDAAIAKEDGHEIRALYPCPADARVPEGFKLEADDDGEIMVVWPNGVVFARKYSGFHFERALHALASALLATPPAAKPEPVDGWGPSYAQPWAAAEMNAAKPEQGDTCERCGATSLAEAESMCIPNGDTCPGCEHPLEQRWAAKAQPKPAGEAVDAEALAKNMGAYVVSNHGPLYVFTPSELATFARRLSAKPAGDVEADRDDLWRVLWLLVREVRDGHAAVPDYEMACTDWSRARLETYHCPATRALVISAGYEPEAAQPAQGEGEK